MTAIQVFEHCAAVAGLRVCSVPELECGSLYFLQVNREFLGKGIDCFNDWEIHILDSSPLSSATFADELENEMPYIRSLSYNVEKDEHFHCVIQLSTFNQ